MSMTRRDFKVIAEIISELREDASQVNTRNLTRWIDSSDLVSELCDYFRTCNPRFDDVKFISACQAKEYECLPY